MFIEKSKSKDHYDHKYNTRRNFNSGTRFGSKSKKGTRQDSRSTTYSGNMTRG